MYPRLIALALLLSLVAPAAGGSDSDPYRVTATIEVLRVSDDGRYAVAGYATHELETTSPDRRYTFKATTASCDPADDRLFANGFESP